MRKTLFYLVTLWMLLWVQVVSNHFLGGTIFSVQWVLLGALHFGLARGPWVGESMGFVWGILMDASSLGLLGLRAALYALAGYAAGMFRRQLDYSKVWTQTILSWMATVIYFGLYLVMARFLSTGEGPFQWSFLTVPIINAILAPFVYRILEFWAIIWDMAPVERNK